MSENSIQIIYILSSICFILAINGLASHKTARFGNIIGMIGMAMCVGITLHSPQLHHKIPIIITILLAAITGGVIALKIEMTAMPQLVAAFHSLVGLSAVLVSYSALLLPENLGIGVKGSLQFSHLLEMSLGAIVGAITFTGSIVAFAKLQALLPSRPLILKGQKFYNFFAVFCLVTLVATFIKHESLTLFNLLVLLSLLLGLMLILPVGGADMPVVVSMLNSYSGFAAVGIGLTLGNSLLIITGALVGASGAILSYIMCKAMNRSLINVIFGAFFISDSMVTKSTQEERIPKISSPEDAAFMLENASSVIIVPGYGMAVAQAQHTIKELTKLLAAKKIDVKFAIHPVAGRMPGHMNVLLAEANIDYDMVYELDEINSDFMSTDIVLVIGANDITNPAAKNDEQSPIYGMPILDVEKSRTVFFIKRSLGAGYAGIENELFFRDNTMMLFGDAKKVVENIVKSFAS